MRTYYLNNTDSLFDEDKGHRLYMHWAQAANEQYLWDARLELALPIPVDNPLPPTVKVSVLVMGCVLKTKREYVDTTTRYLPYTINDAKINIPICSAELVEALEKDEFTVYKKSNMKGKKKELLEWPTAIEVEFAGQKYRWEVFHGEFRTLKVECLAAIGSLDAGEKALVVYSLQEHLIEQSKQTLL